MYDQSVWIGGNFYGSFIRPAVIVHAERQAPYSYAYFCPTCGDVWAKCPTAPVGSKLVNTYQVGGGYCQRHIGPSPFTVPGSLLLAWDEEYSSLLLSCPDVVRWEFERHMEFIERRIENESL